MADDQEVVALRGGPEERLDDLPVGPVDADAEDFDERAPAARDIVDARPRTSRRWSESGLAGDHRDRAHRVSHRSRSSHGLHYALMSASRADEGASRDAVAALEADRQAQEIDGPGLNVAQVRALEDDDARAEQRPVGRHRVAERRDREVVVGDEPYAALDQERRRRPPSSAMKPVWKPGLPQSSEFGVLKRRRVSPAGMSRPARSSAVMFARRWVASTIQAGPMQASSGIDSLARRAIDEVERGVEVRSGVGAELESADVADGARGDRGSQLDPEGRVAFEDRCLGLDRNADVDPSIVEAAR